ncbi:uridine phosphorylase [Mycobacterium sp. 236(2023)]|uniref:uridine phosphorylase n=1 Tax=Mycobacterium sp. 236(2023) TaxID=3038163 RepID=UPI002414F678|nr:uridine phosphorylase [Mycobacterium sp. 236(2023)]MDG4664060.1 uridine phosphorylase [Mycobacterium sp. 236(2023)]
MRAENINRAFLDGVLDGSYDDIYYHLGIAASEPITAGLRDVRAVVMAGSGERIRKFARLWSERNGGSEIIAFPKEDRFVSRYTAGVLFVSHGMGMASASIAVQELMRLVFVLKRGDLEALDEVFWCRVGTSGAVGVPGGSVVVSTEGLMADLKPYRLLRGRDGEYWFDGTFPAETADAIMAANREVDFEIVAGKTVSANDFFLEQYRLDGAVSFETPESKMAWLQWLHDAGVRNIEMEGAMLAGYLNHWGFPKFAMICATVVDRLQGDQMTATPEQLDKVSDDSGVALFNYLDRLG